MFLDLRFTADSNASLSAINDLPVFGTAFVTWTCGDFVAARSLWNRGTRSRTENKYLMPLENS